MIVDNLLLLHGTMSATGVLAGSAANGAGNILSLNTVDVASLSMGNNQSIEPGQGEDLYATFNVTSAPTVGTNVRFQIIQADDAALSSGVQVLGQTDDIPIANLTVGTVVPLMVDRAAPYPPKRYIGARFVNTGAIATAAYVCHIVKSLQDVRNIHFRSGFAVS